MRARWMVGCVLWLAFASNAAGAQPMTSNELRVGWASPVAAETRSAPVLAAAGLAGGAVGVMGGFYLGAALAYDQDDADDLGFLSGGVAGATIGEGLLLPLGVHLANGSRGSYMTSALASLGLAAAGLLALEAVHYDPPGVPIILVTVPLAQLATSIAIERATD